VAHIIHRLHTGGLENGLVNIINHMPEDRYRHAVICLSGYTDFRWRIKRKDVDFFTINKKKGKDLSVHVKLFQLLRTLRPDIVHTRNVGALEYVLPAALAGVRYRVHGEHGRDMAELHGNNWKYNLLRRFCKPLVHKYVSVSRDLALWLREKIGVSEQKIVHIYNGVDVDRFCPAGRERLPLPVIDFAPPHTVVIGSVGRLAEVKDPLTLVRAFLHLRDVVPDGRNIFRLVLVGDGPQRGAVEVLLKSANAADSCWLAGDRDDVPSLLRGFDVFVLPSLAEGIANTILEAMASALPIVATRVGGTPELVIEGVTGMMVPAADPMNMAEAIHTYIRNPGLRRQHGDAGRERIEREFNVKDMTRRYQTVYDALLNQRESYRSSNE
jgi:sugar transferase (PEP-CTERM/EpsH1 system associated)